MNYYRPHVYVIPEDDADRQIANGFVDHHKVKEQRIQVMPVAGGWRHVLEEFQTEYIQRLRNYLEGRVVMLIDFDGFVEERRIEFAKAIPDDLKERVFLVGSRNTPEILRNELSKKLNFEGIGRSLADDCDAGTTELWDLEQLQHNDSERQRMLQNVKPFLF